MYLGSTCCFKDMVGNLVPLLQQLGAGDALAIWRRGTTSCDIVLTDLKINLYCG